VADQAPRYEQPDGDEPQEAPAAVGDADRHGDGDSYPHRHDDRTRDPAPRRPLRPGSRGRGGGRGLGPWPGSGKISQEILQVAPGSRGQGPPGSFLEFDGGQPARLEVLAQIRQHRIAIGIGGPHLSGKIPRRGIHQAAVLPSRAALPRSVVSGFRACLISYALGHRHHCQMPPAGDDICHGATAGRLPTPGTFDAMARRSAMRGFSFPSRTVTRTCSHDLEAAIADLVAGRPAAVQKTEPFGCSIIW
jgi:hypothetical protein